MLPSAKKTGRWHVDALALHRFDEERGHIVLFQLSTQGIDISKGDLGLTAADSPKFSLKTSDPLSARAPVVSPWNPDEA